MSHENGFGNCHDNDIGFGSAYMQGDTNFGKVYEETTSPSTELRYKNRVLQLLDKVRSWFGI